MTDLIQELFAVTQILKGAKCELIDRKKCFVVSHAEFWKILALYRTMGWDTDGDERLGASGYNNVNISLSVADEGIYFVCTRAEKQLDNIWKEPK